MYPTSSIAHETKDVFNIDEFSIKGVFGLEHEPIRDIYFRWTEFHFSIKPRVKSITNAVINVYNLFPFKRIIIITSNFKKEFNIVYGEHSFYVPICPNDQIDIFVNPTSVPTDIRGNLGICLKKVFVYDLEYKYPKKLLDIEEVTKKIEFLNINTGADIKERVKIPFEQQNGKLTILPIKGEGRDYYFNPTIFTLEGQEYLATRYTKVFEKKDFDSELKIFKYPSLEPVPLSINKDAVTEQHEDPRVVIYQDKVIISTANYLDYKSNFYHQKLLVFDKNFNHIKNIHPTYGKNGCNVITNTGDEKNWIFFEHNEKLMFIYKMFPHTVVETDLDGKIITEYKTYFDVASKWRFGEARLSTNPIYKDGYFHSFFHSHLMLTEGLSLSKIYFMGYYKFKAEPPFEIVEVMEEPILWGNNVLPRKEEFMPYCVFPCGVILKNDTFIISLGVNDEHCAILEYKLPS